MQDWVKTNLERLAEKTKKESEEIALQRTQAAEEIEKFYAEREATLGAKRQQNREEDQSNQQTLESSLQKGGWASITEASHHFQRPGSSKKITIRARRCRLAGVL